MDDDVAATTASSSAPRRADARRNRQLVLDAAAAAFVTAGVDAPVRDIAQRAGVGMGTIYRHYPTRADLVIAVYRHQIDACVDAGAALLTDERGSIAGLERWMSLFVDLLVTKHGLAATAAPGGSDAVHQYFVERLVPLCDEFLRAIFAGSAHPAPISAYALLRGVGNLCIGGAHGEYVPQRAAELLVAGVLAAR